LNRKGDVVHRAKVPELLDQIVDFDHYGHRQPRLPTEGDATGQIAKIMKGIVAGSPFCVLL
jgi:hypothetical protein